MFPTLGYFKSVVCPDIDCNRPYCLYRHNVERKRTTSKQTQEIQSVDNAIKKLKEDILIQNEIKKQKRANVPSYIPASYVASKSSGTVLHGARGAVLSPKKSTKAIVYNNSKSRIQNDMEYDPMVNYSAKEFLDKNDTSQSETDEKNNLKRSSSSDLNDAHLSKKLKIDESTSSENEIPATVDDNEDLIEENVETQIKEEIKIPKPRNIDKGRLKEIVKDIFGTSGGEDSTSDVNNLTDNDKPKQSIKEKAKDKAETKKAKNINKEIKKSKLKKTTAKKDEETPKKIKKIKDKKSSANEVKDVDVSKYVSKAELEDLNADLAGKNIYNECLMLYNEYENTANVKKTKKKKHKESVNKKAPKIEVPSSSDTQAEFEEEDTQPKNRRVAHVGANDGAISAQRPRIRRKMKSSPAQIMMSRFQSIAKPSGVSVLASTTASGTSRLAHQPKTPPVNITKDAIRKYRLSTLQQQATTSRPTPQSSNSSFKPLVKTNSNIKQDGFRVAHAAAPKTVAAAVPRITIDRHSKVPTIVRQKYIAMFWKEYLRITRNDIEKSTEFTLAEEEQCKIKSNSKIVYRSVCANIIKRLRALPVLKSKKAKHQYKIQSLCSAASSTITIGIHSVKAVDDEMELYEKMCHYIMSKEQLEQNLYPQSDMLPGRAVIKNLEPLPKPSTADRKICCRCGQEFIMNEKGVFKHDVQCIYHWGRAYNTKVGHHYEKRYSCCSENIGVLGCCIAEVHVHAENKHDLNGYVTTLAKSPSATKSPGIFALDCEMCYTVSGLELTRVSVVDHNFKIVYDTFVKPAGAVLDYNTRWSGITEKDLAKCKVTIRDVQAVFLNKFSADTLFIGHSLESDLVALRIIHSCIIDTAIVFPHKLGHPFKRALRNLMSEYLGIVIQTGASDGHDSHEDAAACMKLMLWKLSEDDKVEGKIQI